MNDERLGAALKRAMDQVEEKGAPYTGLLRQLQELDASRGEGDVPSELVEEMLEAIEAAPPVLIKPERRAAGPGSRSDSDDSRPTPLVELRQVLVDLKSARS